MKRNTLTVAALGAALAAAPPLTADVVTFDGSTSNEFHDGSNWDTGNVPTDEDRIVIPSGESCDIVADGATVEFTVDTMNVSGELNIDDGITLILENDDDNVGAGLGPTNPDHSIVDGTVNVGDGTGGTLFVKNLWIDLDEHIFTGSGTVSGDGSGSVVKVQEDKILTNQIGASGTGGIKNALTIEADSGTATLNNEGRVIADDGGSIVLASSLILDDASDAVWGIDECTRSMTFKRAATLDGFFVLFSRSSGTDGGGKFVIDTPNDKVTTSGALVIMSNNCPAWEWEFASGASFEYETFTCSISPSSCATCEDPCDDCSGNPYVIDTNKTSMLQCSN